MLRLRLGNEEVAMLGASDSIATIAVKSVDEARVYYEEMLGLEVVRELPEGISYRTGGTTLLIYASRYAGTNQATCVTWAVDDVERVAQELNARGVTFEHYDLERREWAHGVGQSRRRSARRAIGASSA
jgi:hypothetical protein